jgi:hypothetical protein
MQDSSWDVIQDLRLPGGENKWVCTKVDYEKTSCSYKEEEKGRANLQARYPSEAHTRKSWY